MAALEALSDHELLDLLRVGDQALKLNEVSQFSINKNELLNMQAKYSARKTQNGLLNGQILESVVLSNNRIAVSILNIGASVTSISVPDHRGIKANVVLGYHNPIEYAQDPFYFGATIGRMAGRIADGKLPVNGVNYQLTKNENGLNHLHGGIYGFDKKVFSIIETQVTDNSALVTLACNSAAGEEGYPGNLQLMVTYVLDHNSVLITYHATTDAATHVNITNHSYFNLSGGTNSGLDQQLFINSDNSLAMTTDFLPTGKITKLNNTHLSFKRPTLVRTNKELLNGRMFNDCYLLCEEGAEKATLYDHPSKRLMKVYTSYPALVFYSGDYLSHPFTRCSGICLEAQYLIDAPNQAYSSQTLLLPGEQYDEFIRWEFGVTI